MNLVPRYQADDGRLFETAAECIAYENRPPEARIEGLSAEQIAGALDRTNVRLADAIEAVAREIVKKRLADGDRRRKAKDAPLLAIEHQQRAAE